VTGDLPAESVSKSDAYGEREVIASFRNLGLPFIAWGLGLTLLPFEILLLWGTWNPGGAWAWSAVALGYALYVGVRGWAPWEMALNQPMRRRHKPDFWLLDPTAYAVGEFLTAARQRIAATLITASAILTPWLIMGLSRLAGGRPVNPKAVLPVSALAFFGFADGIRAGNLAMLLLTRRVERNWGSLSASGTAEVRGGLGGITRKTYVGALLLIAYVMACGAVLAFLLTTVGRWARRELPASSFHVAFWIFGAVFVVGALWGFIRVAGWLGKRGF